MKKIIFLLFVAIAMVACANKVYTLATNDLAGHKFILENFNGVQIRINPSSSLVGKIEFNEDMEISGSFCNNYIGQASLKDGKLYAVVASTRKFCFDERLTQAEGAFFKALSEGANISRSGNVLTITQGGNVFAFRLRD